MLLRIHPSLIMLIAWTYCALFITLGSSDFRYQRFSDSNDGSGSGNGDTCNACPVGTYADNNASGSCNCSCTCSHPPQEFLVKPCNCTGYCTDKSSCKECDFGHHNNKSASVDCIKCEVGYFANTTKAINCTASPKGTFVNGTGAITYENCPLGTFSDHLGAAKCTDCRTGMYCNETDKSGTGCVLCKECPIGFVANTLGTVNCSACARGMYMPHRGGVKCMQCDFKNGEVCTNNDYCVECSHCDNGHEPQTAYNCIPCIAGKYSNESTKHLCKECPSGFYQPNQGQSNCAECPGGFYCPYPSSEPMKCPVGAVCPNGTKTPIYCGALMNLNTASQSCVPTPALYGIIICIVIIVILLVLLIVLLVYWNYCRKKPLPEEKVPLYTKTPPVENPQYGGY